LSSTSILISLIIAAFLLFNSACHPQDHNSSSSITTVSPNLAPHQNLSQTSNSISITSPLEVTPVDLLTNVVIEADCIVSGTISDKRYEEFPFKKGEMGGIHTIFTLSVENMIKGDPESKEVYIKLPGGKTDEYSMIIPGVVYFSVPEIVLVCLKKSGENIYTIMPNGMLWEKSSTVRTSPDLLVVIGRLTQIMKDNYIPIALPPEAIPILPVQNLPDGTSIGFNKDAFIYVCNYGNGKVYIYNLGSFKLISQVSVGEEATIVPSPMNNKLCALSQDTHKLSLINMETNSLEKQITLIEAPKDIAFMRGSDDICVALPESKQIQILNSQLINTGKSFALEEFPEHMGSSSDGKMIYVTTSSKLGDKSKHLIALDSTTGRNISEIDLEEDWHDLTIPEQGDQIFVTNRSSCTISEVNIRSFKIEKTFNNITKRQFPDSAIGGVFVSPNTHYLYFSDINRNYLRAINLKTGIVEKEINMPGSRMVYVSHSGRYLFSAHGGGMGIETGDKSPGSVTIIDIATWNVICRMWIDNGSNEVVGNKAF
jgi:DNA-binding beta-propeller fold protein YncE